jgi:zinc transport system permease protein
MEILGYTFFQNALVGVILISLVTSIIGTYIVTRRMVFVSGGITHSCFGGLGLGYYLGFSPIAMATLFAIGGAFGARWMSHKGGARSDSAIGAMWALGMALGIMFVSMTDGYVPELTSFLFGNVLTITRTDLWIFGGFAAILLLFYRIFFPLILAVSFDSDFSKTRRLPTKIIEIVMTLFIAVAIVLTIRMIGIMLLMSLVTLPQITAELYTCHYKSMMGLSTVISLLGCIGGLMMAYYISVPASACMVLLMLAIYIICKVIRRFTH